MFWNYTTENNVYLFIFRGKLGAIIIGNTATKVSVANLTFVPPFLRFNEVKLFYTNGQKSIEEKCRSIQKYLQPLKEKEALNDSILIRFGGIINRDNQAHFSDHSKLLDYLSEQLLKICNSSRGYNFSTYLRTEEAEAEANVINSIIQKPQICRCSHLRFHLCCVPKPVLLPVEAISSWLNRSIHDGMNFTCRRTAKEIFLRIYAAKIQNAVEMCAHLAEACLFYYIVLNFLLFTVFYGKIYFVVKLKTLGYLDI